MVQGASLLWFASVRSADSLESDESDQSLPEHPVTSSRGSPGDLSGPPMRTWLEIGFPVPMDARDCGPRIASGTTG